MRVIWSLSRVCVFSKWTLMSRWVSAPLTYWLPMLIGLLCCKYFHFIPPSEGLQITFPGLWPNLDQSQGFFKGICSHITLQTDLLCFISSGVWHELILQKCCTAFFEKELKGNATLLMSPRMLLLCLGADRSILVNLDNSSLKPKAQELTL